MFDFDVVTGPTNPTRPAKPDASAAKSPISPPPSAAATAMRDGHRAAERSAADPAGAQP